VVEKDAADLIALLEQNGIEVYVDGGWALFRLGAKRRDAAPRPGETRRRHAA